MSIRFAEAQSQCAQTPSQSHATGAKEQGLPSQLEINSSASVVATVAPQARDSGAPRKRGVPLAADREFTLTRTQPWKQEGMSRSTWYRRQRLSRAKAAANG